MRPKTAGFDLRASLDATVARAIRPLLGALAVSYLALGAFRRFTPEHAGHRLHLPMALATAVLALVSFFVLGRRPLPSGLGHPAAALLAAVVLVNGLVDLTVMAPDETVILMFLAMGAGALFLSWRWLVPVVVATGASWLAVALARRGTDPGDWMEFGAFLGMAIALGLFIHALHLRTVTERLRIEETLREAEAMYRSLIERIAAVTHVSVADETASTIFISPQVHPLLGYTPEEWMADPDLWVKLLHPDDREMTLAMNRRFLAGDGPFILDYRMVTRQGRVVWVHEEASLVRDDRGRALAVQGVLIDITERKRVEEALREAEARFRTLAEQVPAIVYIDEADPAVPGRFRPIYTSPQAESILGYPQEAWKEDPDLWPKLIHPDDRERVLAEDARTTAAGAAEPFSQEYRMVARDGRVLWVHDSARAVLEPAGRQRWHGIMVDVTERKEAEGLLRRSEQELQRSLEVLRHADEERRRLLAHLVDAQEQERRRMAEGIEDEQLQHMTAAALRLGTARRAVADPGELGALDRLESSVQESMTRLRALLVELRPRELETGGIADALGRYLDVLSARSGLRVELEDGLAREPPEEVRVACYRIVQDALRNAVEHSRASSVRVVLEEEENGVRIRIEDDGVALDPEEDPDTLGAAAMRERAELAGGWLRVRGSPGAGTTVEFWLPDRAQETPGADLPRRG